MTDAKLRASERNGVDNERMRIKAGQPLRPRLFEGARCHRVTRERSPCEDVLRYRSYLAEPPLDTPWPRVWLTASLSTILRLAKKLTPVKAECSRRHTIPVGFSGNVHATCDDCRCTGWHETPAERYVAVWAAVAAARVAWVAHKEAEVTGGIHPGDCSCCAPLRAIEAAEAWLACPCPERKRAWLDAWFLCGNSGGNAIDDWAWIPSPELAKAALAPGVGAAARLTSPEAVRAAICSALLGEIG